MPRLLGKFITFEGLDGVGKSTQMENLARWLKKHNIEVLTTREPGGTALGEKLRSVLLSSRTEGLSAQAELALMFADRAQHIHEQIVPELQAGRWVLCDRFTDSSEAYQGGGRQLGSKIVRDLHRTLCGDLQPDLTLLMLADLDSILARARRRNLAAAKTNEDDENRFEAESRPFYSRVLEAYLAIAARDTARVVKVDAKDPVAVVHKKIVRAVSHRLLGEARVGA